MLEILETLVALELVEVPVAVLEDLAEVEFFVETLTLDATVPLELKVSDTIDLEPDGVDVMVVLYEVGEVLTVNEVALALKVTVDEAETAFGIPLEMTEILVSSLSAIAANEIVKSSRSATM